MTGRVTVVGRWERPDGTPAAGVVELEMRGPRTDISVPRIVTPGPITCTLNGQGAIEVDVVASDDPGFRGEIVPYRVHERLTGCQPRTYLVSILGPGPVDLATLTPADPAGGVTIVPVKGDKGDPGPKGDTGDKGEKGDTGAGVPTSNTEDAGSVLTVNPTGTPIWSAVGMTRVRRPSGTDRLIEAFDGTEWWPIYYDSGWRDITTLLLNGWRATWIRARRTAQLVEVKALGFDGSEAKSSIVLNLPVGFRAPTRNGFTLAESTATHLVTVGSSIMINSPSYTQLRNGSFSTTWVPDDKIPTTLPGSASGIAV